MSSIKESKKCVLRDFLTCAASNNPEESYNIEKTLSLIQVLQLSSKSTFGFMARVGELFTPHSSITDVHTRIVVITLSVVTLMYSLFASLDMLSHASNSSLRRIYGTVLLLNLILYLLSRTKLVQLVLSKTMVFMLLYFSPFLIYTAYLVRVSASNQGDDQTAGILLNGGESRNSYQWPLPVVSSFKFMVTPSILSAFLVVDGLSLLLMLAFQFAALLVVMVLTHDVCAFVHIWVPSLIVSLMLHQVLNRFLRLFEQQLNHCYNMMMATSEAILIHRHGKIVDVNPTFLKLFNYSYGESINMTLQDIFVHPDQMALRHEDVLSSSTEGKQVEKVIFECVGRSKTNEEIPLEIIARMKEYLGEMSCVLGIRNIAGRKDKDKLLMTQSEIHAKSRFLTIISHELKTPLNAISISANLLAEDPILPDLLKDSVKIINKSTKHLLHIIKDILDFSKLEVGTLKLEPDFFDLHQNVEDVMDIISQQAFSKNLEIAAYVPRDCPQRLHGDGNRFQQILANLLSNSIKFTDKGQVIVNVEVEEEYNDSIVFYVTVKDSGIGISEEDQKKLFRMFSQVDSSSTRRHGGTGLGLAICKQLVTLMGGNIGVISEMGKGATFWFTVRFAKPPVSPEQMPNNQESRRKISNCNTVILYGAEPMAEANAHQSRNASVLDLCFQRRTSTMVVEYLADASKRTVIMQGGKEVGSSLMEDTYSNYQPKHDSNSAQSPRSSPIELQHPIKAGNVNFPRVLVMEQNREVAEIINRYVTSFGAEPILVLDPGSIPTNALTKPINCVIIDENCFMGLDLMSTLALIASIKRQILLSNQQHKFKPERPLIILLTQGPTLLEEQIMFKFKNIIRKPVYLSSFERIFYNDLEAHVKNPEFDCNDCNTDADDSPEYHYLESYAFDSSTQQIPALNKRHSRERIVVNFEFVDDGRHRASASLSLRSSQESAISLQKSHSELYLLAPISINGAKSPSLQRLTFTNTPKILCAEDQEMNIKVIQKLLLYLSAEVEIATDGIEALKMLNIPLEESQQQQAIVSPYKYQVILMDGNMPKMCGIETTKKIRQFEQIHKIQPIPIIGITATDEKTYIEECISEGMNEVIFKPISKNKLFAALSKYCT